MCIIIFLATASSSGLRVPGVIRRAKTGRLGSEQGGDRKWCDWLGDVKSIPCDDLPGLLKALIGQWMAAEVALQSFNCNLAKLVNRRTGVGHIFAMEFGPAFEQRYRTFRRTSRCRRKAKPLAIGFEAASPASSCAAGCIVPAHFVRESHCSYFAR
jgi:hypothetical protein